MKLIKNIVILVYIVSIFAACSNNEDPVIINEEELITTVRATLIPEGGGAEVVLKSVDLDGDGPNEPTIEVIGTFNPNTTYAGTLKILNEVERPAEDITLEILEEDEDHQFFFSFTNDIATATYDDEDSNGNPVGVQFNLLTGAADSSGGFTIILRHEPDKAGADVNTGDITNADGSTDVQVTFNIVIE